MARYLIDITRFMSRIGHGKPTGIDRVELAYIKELSRRDPECLAVAKLGSDYLLIPAHEAVRAIRRLDAGQSIGRDGIKDFYRLKIPKTQRRARQYFRSVATKQAQTPSALFACASLHGVEYVNVGHSNLADAFLTAIIGAGCADISIMIHDMIPLDYPEYTRDGISAQFAVKMEAALRHADRIICNSADTETRVKHYAQQWGLQVGTVVAHLGVEPLASPAKIQGQKPYFVCLGTIEPRKNHALLFKVWQALVDTLPAEDVPDLHVIGRRGWKNDDVFRFLDTSPLMGCHIFEHANLDDAELAANIGHSSGLLFPSHAEGFGLPALEAAQIGVDVICSDLPVFHEILGGYATFVDAADTVGWINAVKSVAEMTRNDAEQHHLRSESLSIPQWESHFCHVFGDTETKQVVHE